MGLMVDIHVHTRRFSPCSTVDPEQLIDQAVRAGLDGVVVTEHGCQWDQAELDALAASSDIDPDHLALALASDRGSRWLSTELRIGGRRAGRLRKFAIAVLAALEKRGFEIAALAPGGQVAGIPVPDGLLGAGVRGAGGGE